MDEQETVTLRWTRTEITYVVRCLSLYLPKAPLVLSASDGLYYCPVCYAEVKNRQTNYCPQCGQCFDWNSAYEWGEKPTDFPNKTVSKKQT